MDGSVETPIVSHSLDIPAPFVSDGPVSEDERSIDKAIALIIADVREGRIESAVSKVENLGRYMKTTLIDEPVLSPGNKQQTYAYASDEHGVYIHFALADSSIPYFVPTACKAAAVSGRLDVKMGMDGDPDIKDAQRVYFDVSCTPDVHIRLYSKLGTGDHFIDGIMIFKTAASADRFISVDYRDPGSSPG